jgi:hypothetical protein
VPVLLKRQRSLYEGCLQSLPGTHADTVSDGLHCTLRLHGSCLTTGPRQHADVLLRTKQDARDTFATVDRHDGLMENEYEAFKKWVDGGKVGEEPDDSTGEKLEPGVVRRRTSGASVLFFLWCGRGAKTQCVFANARSGAQQSRGTPLSGAQATCCTPISGVTLA